LGGCGNRSRAFSPSKPKVSHWSGYCEENTQKLDEILADLTKEEIERRDRERPFPILCQELETYNNPDLKNLRRPLAIKQCVMSYML
jgi:hypothetical protein